VTTKGRVRPLRDTLEENLLRIAQSDDPMSSSMRKQPQRGSNSIIGAKNVVLRIKDNGAGSIAYEARGRRRGHFGCWACLNGRNGGRALTIQSEPGSRTLVEIQVGLDRQNRNRKKAWRRRSRT